MVTHKLNKNKAQQYKGSNTSAGNNIHMENRKAGPLEARHNLNPSVGITGDAEVG